MRRLLVPSLGLLALAVSCDLVHTANQLQAKTVMIGTVMATPPWTFNPAAAFDSGFPMDSGFSFDAGMVNVPGQTGAYVYMGTLSSLTLDQPPAPISDATVTLAASGGNQIALPGDGGGSYSQTSLQNGAFQYQSGATYDFTAVEGGNTYVGEISPAPVLEKIAAFPAPPGFLSLPANTDFTFTRPDPPVGQSSRNLGFVTVFPLDSSGKQGSYTFTNVPQTPLDFLTLIAAPSNWKQAQVTITGSKAFPQSQSTYLIVFEGVQSGGPKSDNLFTGSALLAGAADLAIVRTQ